MHVIIEVTLKPGVLDPQGKATEHSLQHLGFDQVSSVRIGKRIELEVATGTDQATIEQMCEKLLANTVIESYRIMMPEAA